MDLTAQKIQRARSGDEEASREVILSALSIAKRAYRSRSRSICEMDVPICLDDLLQDFALKLQKTREEWPSNYFRLWLIQVWRNFLIDRYRKAAKTCRVRVDASPEGYRDDEHSPPGLSLDVRRARESLTELQDKALYCKFWQDMSYEEAAEALNTTEDSIRGRISRGYERVREFLSEYESLFDQP